MNNVLSELFAAIDNPLAYHCRLWGYVPGHSQLLVRVHQGEFLNGEVFFLGFEGVHYVECPTSWIGIDFRLGSPEECKAVIRKANLVISAEMIDVFLNAHHLFVIDRSDCRIQILAWAAHRLSQVPEHFRGSPKA